MLSTVCSVPLTGLKQQRYLDVMSNEAVVWCDGKMIPCDQLPISAFDLGLTVGMGVFETMIAYRGTVVTFIHHYERLKASGKRMQLNVLDEDTLSGAISEVIARNGLCDERARVRITLVAGARPLHKEHDLHKKCDHLMISAARQPAPKPSAELTFVSTVLNERSSTAGLKTTSYTDHVLAYREALKGGADEGILINTRGHLSECTMSNIFIVKKGELYTPSLSSGCLPGVTRAIVLKHATQEGIAVHECDLTKKDLEHADEIFITSSAREVQPACVHGCDKKMGPITKQLQDRYRTMIESGIVS